MKFPAHYLTGLLAVFIIISGSMIGDPTIRAASPGLSTPSLQNFDTLASTGAVVATARASATSENKTPGVTGSTTATAISPAEVCASPPDHIYELQENGSKFNPSGTLSPARTVIGVVTGDFQPASPDGLDGFYLQDESGDNNPATSDGIFVYDPSPFLLDVTLGQRVQVTGGTKEFNGLTEMVATAVMNCGVGSVMTPISVTLPVNALNDFEKYESMRVTVSAADGNPLTVTETYDLALYGEIEVAAGGRLFTPTNYVEPGAAANAEAASNNLRRLLIDDGRNGTPPNGQVPYIPTTGSIFREGFTVPSLTGVLSYAFNVYRLEAAGAIAWSAANPRTDAPVVGGTLRVASLNVLSFFNGNGTGADGAAGGFPTARGADSLAEFNRQLNKTIAAMTGLNADVIAVNELENDDTAGQYGAIEQLVDGLNATAGSGTYSFIDTGIVGTDQIRTGLIYRPGKVTPIGVYAKLDNVAPFNDNTRPPIAQLFEENATGEHFYLVANHFKSKGCADAVGGDTDQGDGQGCYNPTRVQAATALLNWINTDAYFDSDSDVLIMGDLNSYAREDPIDTLKNGGYTSLIETWVGAGNVAYSYTFDGESGYLDHALASPSLLTQTVGAAEWHINADEPSGRDYNDSVLDSDEAVSELRQPYLYEANAYRASDHDPVLVGLALGNQVTPTVTPTATQPPFEELLVNGGFEAQNGGQPDLAPWLLKHGTADRIKCNQPDQEIAYEGNCAFVFKGSTSENATLVQQVNPANFDFSSGDTLTISGFVRAKQASVHGKLKVRITYSNTSLNPGKININLGQTSGGYQPLTGTTSVTLVDSSIAKIRIVIKHTSTSGKLYLDSFSLSRLAAGNVLLSLPE